MIEAPPGTDLWHDIIADAVVITTNGDINSQGRAVMGRGCALEAARLFPGIDRTLAAALREHGNHVQVLDHRSLLGRELTIASFPVKHHWHQPADLKLIERSVRELIALANELDWQTVVMPRPGCGNGRLCWEDVKPLLAGLDDRFVIVHK
jgi:hypothetical protein